MQYPPNDKETAILIHTEEQRGLHETLYLQSIPGMVESILAASAEPLEDCIPVEELLPDV